MGNLYNLLFGKNPISSVLLKILNLTEGDFSRFRDAYLEDGCVCVLTRMGGNNRECWSSEYVDPCECLACRLSKIREHPLYIDDIDDDFDCTYSVFKFTIPEEYKELQNITDENVISLHDKISKLLAGISHE